MNSIKDISSDSKTPSITLVDEKQYDDGSISVNYILNHYALKLCAEKYEKDVESLTEEEIHTFVALNLSGALKGHDGWKVIKQVENEEKEDII